MEELTLDDPTLVASSDQLSKQTSMTFEDTTGSLLSRCNSEFTTPDPICSQDTDCRIVGNKWKSLMEDESNHSKWEEFKRIAKAASSHEECSQQLRRMELQNSDDEMEIQDLDDISVQEPNLEDDRFQLEAILIEDKQDKKKKKRTTQWGPIQRISRPRRFPKDGKTMMQKAQEYKNYLNLCQGTKPTKPLPTTTLESNDPLISITSGVDIVLGSDENIINHNIDVIRDNELKSRTYFLEKKS